MPVEQIGGFSPSMRIGNEEGAALPLPGSKSASEGQGFGKMLAEAIGDVNALQMKSGDLTQRYARGEDVDIHNMMIASEQAGISMQLTLQIRNKLVEAYQEVMRTQV